MADRILNLRKDGLDVAVTAVARDDKANRGVMDLISKVRLLVAQYLLLAQTPRMDRFSTSRKMQQLSSQVKRLVKKSCLFV